MIGYRGRNRRTVTYLKTIQFDYPEWTICSVGLMPATWMKYGGDLDELVLAHPRIFPDHEKGSKLLDVVDNPLYEMGQHTDCWGVVWENMERGLDSIVVSHPLQDWSALDDYIAPDPLKDDMFGPRDWKEMERTLEDAKREGGLARAGGLPHGFMYMKLFYLRGFGNLMIDLATNDPRLRELIQMVEDYNTVVICRCLAMGAEAMGFGDDLGTQGSLPMSPAMWRQFIKPTYERMFRPCRDADVPIYLHTDGHFLEIIPDLIEVGVSVLNPQISANGLAGLQEVARGKVALSLDLDRQFFPFATPSQIEDHIGEAFDALYLPEGGLMLYAECEPDVPLGNIDAICGAFERICNPPMQ